MEQLEPGLPKFFFESSLGHCSHLTSSAQVGIMDPVQAV